MSLPSEPARPAKARVADKLKRLTDLKAAVDLTRLDYEAKRSEILKKVQAELDALDSEYQPVLDAAQENASALEAEIRNDVLLVGESVHSDLLQAIYVRPRHRTTTAWATPNPTRRC
jgi:hypothetical protein